MRCVLSRVQEASVCVNNKTTGEIREGLLVLAGVEKDDTEKDIEYTASKIVYLRIFEDDTGRMNLSVKDVNGSILVVSQFTLLGNTKKGRRPGYDRAEDPDVAEKMIEMLINRLKDFDITVETGKFQTEMKVKMTNRGPVTVIIDSRRDLMYGNF